MNEMGFGWEGSLVVLGVRVGIVMLDVCGLEMEGEWYVL